MSSPLNSLQQTILSVVKISQKSMYVKTCVTFKLSFNVLKSLIFEGLKRAIFQMRMLRLDHCVES